uniref:Uncharacterized protein n=1 Tax=Anguilla anguilla TaxID=7936 RepID=A0A0E9PCL7_ANGAN
MASWLIGVGLLMSCPWCDLVHKYMSQNALNQYCIVHNK